MSLPLSSYLPAVHAIQPAMTTIQQHWPVEVQDRDWLVCLLRLVQHYQRWLVQPGHLAAFPDWQTELIDLSSTGLLKIAEHFFERFEQCYFPTRFEDLMWLNGFELTEHGFEFVWPAVQGLDYFFCDIADFPEPIRMLLALWATHWDEDLLSGAYWPGHYGSLDLHQLAPAALAAQLPAIRDILLEMTLPEKLHGLPYLIGMIFKDTGNLFLDFGLDEFDESGMLYGWQPQTIQSLAQAWQQAEPILGQLALLQEWITGNPRHHCQLIIDVLHYALQIHADRRRQEQQPSLPLNIPPPQLNLSSFIDSPDPSR